VPDKVGNDRYPIVDCDVHGQQRSYVMCLHVMGGGRPAGHVVPASDGEMGEALCEECHAAVIIRAAAGNKIDLDEFKMVCEQHAREFCGEVP
jgi:hypothetical protein